MPKAEEIYSCEAEILRQTMKAVLIKVDDEELWLPRSQLIDDEELPTQGEARVKMTAWLAKTKGLL